MVSSAELGLSSEGIRKMRMSVEVSVDEDERPRGYVVGELSYT